MKQTIFSIAFLLATLMNQAQTPQLQWVKNMGSTGNGSAYPSSIALDAAGNVYTTGGFSGTFDFDPGAGVYNLTATSNSDNYISKMDASGNLLWVKSITGNTSQYAATVAVDTAGNVYTMGNYNGTITFHASAGIVTLASQGNGDIFILKLDTAGNFVWAKSMGGTGNDEGNFMALDAAGNVYTTGFFTGTAQFGSATSLTSAGANDIFISKLNPAGDCVWAIGMGSTGSDQASSIAVDTVGNAYITGYYEGTADFDPTTNNFNLTSLGHYDVFVAKYDNTGALVWAESMGGNGNDEGELIAVDKAGNVYAMGSFNDTIDIDPSAAGVHNLMEFSDYNNLFITKMDGAGKFVWARTMFADDDGPEGLHMTTDALGNVYVAATYDADMIVENGTDSIGYTAANENDNMFISKLDTAGNIAWARNFVSNLSVDGAAMAVDGLGNIYATGFFEGTVDFDPDPTGVFDVTTVTGQDIFVMKMGQNLDGIAETGNMASNISVYPNPTNGLFSIAIAKPTDNMHLAIYNSLGAMVYEQTTANGHNTVDLANQANGLYFVRVTSNNELMATQKIIKQ